MKKIQKAIQFIKKYGLYPPLPVINSPHSPEMRVDGKKVFMFASNNYLSLMADKRVIGAAQKGLEKWGIGNGGSRLATGNLEIHEELEKEIAKFKNKESALTFVTGYMVNEGCIPAIANVVGASIVKNILFKSEKSETIIFSDEYNHASIVSGVKLANAGKEVYKHNDMDDLESRLKKYSKRKRKLIITDGVFSMDGDIVNFPRMYELAKKYNAITYLDDAHATGILGPNGRGTEDYFNMEGSADFAMGTFTKAFGGVGGYITAKKEIIDYLRVIAKTSIFTAPIAPPVACGLIESVKIAKKEKWRRENLVKNAKYLRDELNKLGYNTMNSNTQIIPVLIGDEKEAMRINKVLLKNRIFIPVIRWPVVPKKQARLRITLMAEHTKEHLDYLLEILKKIKK